MSQTQIINKLPDYPYEFFFNERDDGIIECLVDGCDETFVTEADYLCHYQYNNHHTSFIKRALMRYYPRRDLGEELIWDPIEKEQIEHNIKTNPDYAALKYGRDVTYLLNKKIKFSVDNNRSINAEAIGVRGTGKSLAMIALGYIISGMWADKLNKITKVGLDFEQSKILEMIGSHTKGDTLIQDEDPTGFGTGSKTNTASFENLAKTLRKRGISLLVVSPIETKIKVLDFIIEFFAYYPKERITKGVLYTRKKLALGYIYIEILDEEDYVEYEKMKDTFIDKMQSSGGFGVQNYDDDRIQRDFDLLLKNVTDVDPNMTKGRIIGRASVIVGGDSGYQKMIADDVHYHLKNIGAVTKVETGVEGLGARKLSWKLIETIKDENIGDVIYEQSKPRTKQQKMGRGWWKYYFCTENAKGEQARDFLNEEFDESFSKTYYYNNLFSKFTEDDECFGKAVERAVQERYYPEHIVDGGIGKPDLIGKDDYIEVKARKKGTTRDILSYFTGNSYVWKLLEDGADVKLLEFIYDTKRRFEIKSYQLTYNEDKTNE